MKITVEKYDPGVTTILPDEYYEFVYIKWDIKTKFPKGKIMKYGGKIGSIEGETNRLLNDYISTPVPFSNSALEDLNKIKNEVPPSTQEYIIPEEEIKRRHDLRDKRIFTVDNEDTKDIDDAVHIEKKGENVYELGVHIADVSYFVKENTELDKEARGKVTSIYLVDQTFPMLPNILTNNVCSLRVAVDRLAFSVLFRMNENGELLSEYEPIFVKSIIRSRSKMSYNTLQKIINKEIKEEEIPQENKIHNCTFEEMQSDGTLLNTLMQKRRKNRILKEGSFAFEKRKFKFILKPDGYPIKMEELAVNCTHTFI